jgi:hypothetical protein
MTKSTQISGVSGRTGFFYRLGKKELAKAYPGATADLVLYCLQSAREQFAIGKPLADLWSDLRGAKVAAATSDAIRSEALRLGMTLEVQ